MGQPQRCVSQPLQQQALVGGGVLGGAVELQAAQGARQQSDAAATEQGPRGSKRVEGERGAQNAVSTPSFSMVCCWYCKAWLSKAASSYLAACASCSPIAADAATLPPAACCSCSCCTCGSSVRSRASQKWKSADTLMPLPACCCCCRLAAAPAPSSAAPSSACCAARPRRPAWLVIAASARGSRQILAGSQHHAYATTGSHPI